VKQIDRLVARAFKNLKADEVLNFSVAVTVMRVQRKWRSRMRAAKLKRKREVGPPATARQPRCPAVLVCDG
jgi:hypothetical protein